MDQKHLKQATNKIMKNNLTEEARKKKLQILQSTAKELGITDEIDIALRTKVKQNYKSVIITLKPNMIQKLLGKLVGLTWTNR